MIINKTQLSINNFRKGILMLMTIFLSVLSISIGVESFVFKDIFVSESFTNLLFFSSRLPRTVSILLAGFGMSISGLIFQQISHNKYVSPTTSGSVSGAQLGVALVIAYSNVKNTGVVMLVAFFCALLVSVVFMTILKHIKFKEMIYVPLLGLMLTSLVTSLTTFVAYRYNFLQILQGWFYGSFSLVTSGRYEMLYFIIIPMGMAFTFAKTFTIVSVGESFATNLGIKYDVVVRIGVFITAVVSACIVVVVGSVPFLGLVVPNVVSMYAGDNLQKNILDVGLIGMNFLLFCDLLSRLIIYPYELPIAMIVGVLGTGFFLVMLLVTGGKK